MDAVEFLKERDRMCKENADCGGCSGEGAGHRCMVYFLSESNGISTEMAERTVAIVEEWSKAHPRKTMKQDFFEKFPDAPKQEDGSPKACPYQCGYTKRDDCVLDDVGYRDCLACWSCPMEE